MKIPVIKVKDKRTDKDAILTDKMEILRVVQSGEVITLEDMQYFKSDFKLSENAIKYMSLLEIYEQFIDQEVRSLRNREIDVAATKCKDLLKKLLIMVENEQFALSQEQLDFGYSSIRIPIMIDGEEQNIFEVWHEVNITKEEWDKVTKDAFKVAKESKTKEECVENMTLLGYTQKELLDVCLIYFDFCNGLIDQTEGKRRIEQIKGVIVKNVL